MAMSPCDVSKTTGILMHMYPPSPLVNTSMGGEGARAEQWHAKRTTAKQITLI